MARYVEVRLEKRGVSAKAILLDDDAPATCELIWNGLPLGAEAWHAKYAMNEVYTLIAPIDGEGPGLENATVTPIPGDLVYFYFPAGHIARQFRESIGLEGEPGIVDLAVFYGRNNFLFNASTGFVPGNVFGTIVENLEEMAAACNDVWRNGSVGERLTFHRLDDDGHRTRSRDSGAKTAQAPDQIDLGRAEHQWMAIR